MSQNLISEGYAADDGVALHFIGEGLTNIVSSRPEAKAYYLGKKNGTVLENTLNPKYLGS